MEYLQDFILWFFEGFFKTVDLILTPVVDLIPELDINFSQIENVLVIVNKWVPLDYALSLVIIYFSISLVLVLIRLMLKLIPFVG